MTSAMMITIDSAGRVVLPKEIRDEAQLEPGMPLRVSCHDGRIEIEPAGREVRIAKKGRIRVAVPVEGTKALTSETVRATTKRVRGRRK